MIAKCLVAICTLVAMMLSMSGLAYAQAYPSQSIKIIVSLARICALKKQEVQGFAGLQPNEHPRSEFVRILQVVGTRTPVSQPGF